MGKRFALMHTATGNELPDVRPHIERVARACEADIIDLEAPTLAELIEEQQCLPNFQMRWCTRMIKVEPALRFYDGIPGETVCVGLRADEEGRMGIEADGYELNIRYPLREWNWGEAEVVRYCKSQGFSPPVRTDCAVCFYQTLHEWWLLWRDWPDEYARGEQWETDIGHTFRSPKRDTRPAALCDLRREFERGYIPKPRKRKTMCRVCDS
jgi:hypothetical protein